MKRVIPRSSQGSHRPPGTGRPRGSPLHHPYVGTNPLLSRFVMLRSLRIGRSEQLADRNPLTYLEKAPPGIALEKRKPVSHVADCEVVRSQSFREFVPFKRRRDG